MVVAITNLENAVALPRANSPEAFDIAKENNAADDYKIVGTAAVVDRPEGIEVWTRNEH
eukprot:CAMPEP_0195300518 /NCGR_PEP_ID=MMETSP0707-20130614/27592_1 /TAXON_ID=33640 /ORGANISM="Asterionellopsis glacialis, Strain CCMP134" /LENGTH=58 /DNA_ID=CAMNT_0040363233 /DNA_START=368 /DNA_END=544 /DNA_ORIENTATION=+